MINFSDADKLSVRQLSALTRESLLRDFLKPDLEVVYVVENAQFRGLVKRETVGALTSDLVTQHDLAACANVTVTDAQYPLSDPATQKLLKREAVRRFISQPNCKDVVLLNSSGEFLGAWAFKDVSVRSQVNTASKYAALMQRELRCVGGYLAEMGCRRVVAYSPGDKRRARPLLDTLVISELAADPRVDLECIITETQTTIGNLPVKKPSEVGALDVDAVVVFDDNLKDEVEYRFRTSPHTQVHSLTSIVLESHMLEMGQSDVLEQLFTLGKQGHQVLFVVTPIVERLAKRTAYEDLLMTYRTDTIHKFLANVDYLFPSSFLHESFSQSDWVEKVERGMSTLLPYKGYVKHRDLVSELENVTDGIRRTVDVPLDAPRRLLVFGDSVTYGRGVPDSETVVSRLQAVLNRKGVSIQVENRSVSASGVAEIGAALADGDIRDGDIIVVSAREGNVERYMGRLAAKNGVPFYRARPDFEYVPGRPELFFDMHHLSPTGADLLASGIFDRLFAKPQASIPAEATFKHLFASSFAVPTLTEYYDPIINSEEFRRYIQSLADERKPVNGKVGGIVVNCNPFTFGHQFLIETAAAQCDMLYVFVVEEDRSVFPFSDRLELVRAGTAHLPNVEVLPSGEFMISARTFPEYFQKGSLQETTIDPSEDVMIFGKYVAPALGITKRLVGEEPLDRVTLQYNQAMARILPGYGIEFEIIPRKEEGEMVISASRVRRLLEVGDLDAISKLVPETTLSYLKSKFGSADAWASALQGDTQRSATA